MVNELDEKKTDQSLITQTPLPPKARSINKLNIKEKITFHKKIELHPVFLASKKDKPSDDPGNLFFFKLNSKNSPITQLEAYCGAISRLIAPNYVPSLSIYYNEQNCFIGIASKAWSHYQANADDPLTFEDIQIGNTNLDVICQKKWLQHLVGEILEQKNKDASSISNYFDLSFLINMWSPEPTIVPSLKNFHEKDDAFTDDDVNALLLELNKRSVFLKNKKELTPAEKKEWQLLYDIIETIEKLYDMESQPYQTVTIEDMVAFEEALTTQDDGLTKKILNDSQLAHFRRLQGISIALMVRYLFKEGDNHNANIDKDGRLVDFNMTKLNILFDYKEHNIFDYLFRRPQPNTFVCTAYDIDHFPDIKDANLYFWPTKQTQVVPILIETFSKFLDQSANFTQDNDDVIQQKILTLVTDVMITINLSDNILLDRMTRALFSVFLQLKALFLNVPLEELADTERRKYVFSLLRDNFISFVNRYQDGFAFLEAKAHEYFGPKHYYSEQDNRVFQKLACHPVVEYYKYRTLLKYLLTDAKLYQHIAELYFPSEQQDLHNRSDIGLDPAHKARDYGFINRLTSDERLRLEEIKNVVIDMASFQNFLKKYGDLALQGILREFNQYKTKYAAKIEEKPYYNPIIGQVDEEKFNERYRGICVLSGITPIMEHKAKRIRHS